MKAVFATSALKQNGVFGGMRFDQPAIVEDRRDRTHGHREAAGAGRIRDERIALQHNTLGQETTGAGGFAMAMRSIPAILET
jgi:6-phospho-beta-glucosidase